MFATILLSLLVPAPLPALAVASQDPAIRIELNNDRQFVRGEHGKVKIRTDDDGFLVVLHADPDGRVRVLFPLDPGDDNYVRGHHTYELRDRGDRETFTVEAGSGQGAIYAAVSRDPFRFDGFTLNRHWDYDALNTEDPGSDPEPVLGDLVQRMASGRYDYDYVTYDVYESAYSSVSYGSPAVVYTPSSYYYSSYYCDPFYNYYCDPYYYSPSRFNVAISVGSPYYYRPYYYDPFYYGYYSPYYYRPARYYGYPSYPYYNSPGGVGYRPRYSTPSEFKQTDRLWNGAPYRDRLSASPVRSVNTVYDPAPVRRGTTQGDMGRSPVQSSPPAASASPRRRVEASPSRSGSAAPAERQAPERRQAAPARTEPRSEPRQSSPPSREATPSRRRREGTPQGAPELQRRTEPSSSPRAQRAEPERRGTRVSRPEASTSRPSTSRPTPIRSEPVRRSVERPAPQVRQAPRSEPAARSAPPPRSAGPSRASAPAPSRGSSGGGGGGGGRRGPR